MNDTTSPITAIDPGYDDDGLRDALRRWYAFDDSRPSIRNEHALTAAAGAGLAVLALFTPSRGKAVCRAVLGGMLLFRAASGRDGLRRWAGAPDRGSADATSYGG